jgi:hypothetical protein
MRGDDLSSGHSKLLVVGSLNPLFRVVKGNTRAASLRRLAHGAQKT